jgi:hypothetical protein
VQLYLFRGKEFYLNKLVGRDCLSNHKLGGYIMVSLKIIIFSSLIFIMGCSATAIPDAQKRNSVSEGRAQSQDLEPEKVAICQLLNDPAAYNHKLVEVTGFFSHGFENSTVSDPGCESRNGVWLEYGGTSATGTMYCCGVTAEQSRPDQLVVKDIPIPLVDDGEFRKFDKVIQSRPDSIVRSTVVGRFFPGHR